MGSRRRAWKHRFQAILESGADLVLVLEVVSVSMGHLEPVVALHILLLVVASLRAGPFF
jgi:hypothetical protein